MRELIALLCGAGLANQMPVMPPNGFLLALLMLAVILLYCAKYTPSPAFTSLIKLFACCLLAFSLLLLRAAFTLDTQWPKELDGRVLRMQFQIESQPIATDKAWRLNGRIQSLSFPGGQPGANLLWASLKGKRIRLRLYFPTARRYLGLNSSTKLGPVLLQDKLNLNIGRTVLADIKLKAPRGLHNFGAADFQARMLSESIVASGYIRKLHSVEGMARFGTREGLAEFINEQKLQHAPLIKGLLLGDRSDLKHEHWLLLQQTGTGHLLAISGLHIGLVAGIGMLIFGLAGRSAQLLSERSPMAQNCSLWGGGFSAIAYAWLADFSLPTQRALLMLWLYLLVAIAGRVVSPWRVFLMALLLLLLRDPWALEQAGGCLSFAAVAALIYGYWAYSKTARTLAAYSWQLLRSQLLIASFLTAVLCYLQLPSGSLSLPANLLAIPWLSFVIMPLLLIACLSWLLEFGWHWPLHWADKAIDGLWRYLQTLLDLREMFNEYVNLTVLDTPVLNGLSLQAQFLQALSLQAPSALWWPAIPFNAVSFCLMLLAAFLFWLPKGSHGRFLFLLPLLCLLSPSNLLSPDAEKLQITVLDVGQGLAVLIEKNAQAVLYDTGPRYSDEYDAGASVVAPFLRGQGIRRLEHMIVSHGDSDHSGGLRSLLEQFPVKQFWTEPGYLQKLPSQDLSINQKRHCVAGESWQWQGIHFKWLWPTLTPSRHSAAGKQNNRSCVLLMQYQNLKILLPGDIERWAEQEILKNMNEDSILCNLDVLLLPHHGSHSSSHKAWADCTRPLMVVSSTAWQNRYGHPSAKVLRRYPHSLQFDTGRDGAIQLQYEPKSDDSMQLKHILRSRQERRRYWQEHK